MKKLSKGMRVSTRQPSQDKPTKTKPKVFKGERTVGGLAFLTNKPYHTSIFAWAQAGAPDNVYIHDTVDNLILTGIPIVDARVVRGMYIRNRISPMVKCKIDTSYAVTSSDPVVKKKIDIIRDADTKDHHSMSY